MNLTSCEKCGVVLDLDKIEFPKNIHLEDGSVDLTLGAWDGDDYVPFTKCPVCESPVLG